MNESAASPRRRSRRVFLAACAAIGFACPADLALGADRPAWTAVRSMVQRQLAETPGRQAGDILSQSDVRPVFEKLAKAGWTVPDQKAILRDVLNDSDFLIATLRSRGGQRFMRKVSGDSLIYDRLDRVARSSGGKALLRSLVELPDGEKYAKRRRPRAVPGLLELLPKNSSGKTRTIRDYSKPTGRIYTEADLLKRLEESYRNDRSKDK